MKQNEGFHVELAMDLSSKYALELQTASNLLLSSLLNAEFIIHQIGAKYGVQIYQSSFFFPG